MEEREHGLVDPVVHAINRHLVDRYLVPFFGWNRIRGTRAVLLLPKTGLKAIQLPSPATAVVMLHCGRVRGGHWRFRTRDRRG